LELDRNAIERSDFAQARRGYDPDEVDTHLAEVAAAFEQLTAKPYSSAAMAGAAADQVRTIVEAAQHGANEIESGAQTEAARMIAEAKREADEERAQARTDAAQARDRAETDAKAHVASVMDAKAHVASVMDATAELRSRAETVQADLNGMVGKLYESIDAIADSARANADSLESELRAHESSHEAGAAEPEPEPPSLDKPDAADEEPGVESDTDEPVAEAGEEPVAEPELTSDEPVTEPEPEMESEDEPLVLEPVGSPEAEQTAVAPDAGGGGGDGAEGARLIALNMALNGTPREETSRYLEENFDLESRETLLDEVYSRGGG